MYFLAGGCLYSYQSNGTITEKGRNAKVDVFAGANTVVFCFDGGGGSGAGGGGVGGGNGNPGDTLGCATAFANDHSLAAGISKVTGLDKNGYLLNSFFGNDVSTVVGLGTDFWRSGEQLPGGKLANVVGMLPNPGGASRAVFNKSGGVAGWVKPSIAESVGTKLLGSAAGRAVSKLNVAWTVGKFTYDLGAFVLGAVVCDIQKQN